MKITAFEDNEDLHPRDMEDFGFTKDFNNVKSRVSLDFEDIVLCNEDYEKVYDWIYTGYGRGENIPAVITDNEGNEYPHYLDLSEVTFRSDEVQVGIQARKGTDHFFESAEGLTFELLRQKGWLPDSLFIEVPYMIVPDNLQLHRIVALSLEISLLAQLRQVAFEISKLIADGLDIVGTGVLTTIAKAISLAIWLALTIVQLVIASIQLKELYFPKVRYFKSCSDFTLIQKGCQYLGYSLDSTALINLQKAHTLPTPQSVPGQSIFQKLFNEFSAYFNDGYPTAQDSCNTLWAMIEDYLRTYNLKIFVYNGTVKIERKDWFIQNANLVVKPTYSLQDQRSKEWTYNNSAIYGRKYFSYTTDFTDAHCPDSNIGSQAEYITEPVNFLNADLVNLKGLDEYKRPYAWGSRKNELTRVESSVLEVFQYIDALIDIIGGNSNLSGNILNRIGVMVISEQFFSVTKKLWLNSDGKQPSNYADFLSMDNIILDYHDDLTVKNNCFRLEKMKIPFTQGKFNSLLQNNFVILESGEVVEVANCTYKDRKYSSEITLMIPDNSMFNTKNTKLG